MRSIEAAAWRGDIRIEIHRNGHLHIAEFRNLITDAGLNLLAEALREAAFDAEIKYLAWGDDNTTPAAGDTALGNELGRKLVTSQAAGTTGETDTTVYLGPDDANGTIEELGWFAGDTATATKDSGVLIARVLWSHSKDSLESVQVVRTDTLA